MVNRPGKGLGKETVFISRCLTLMTVPAGKVMRQGYAVTLEAI
jgi:hypothetical protein